MNNQLTALLTELQSLRKEVTELKHISLKQNELLEKRSVKTFELVKSEPKQLPAPDGLDGRITALLQELKIPAHLKGYALLRDALKYVILDAELLRGFTKNLYPFLAKKYNTTWTCVERAIRNAIETSYHRNYFHPLYQKLFMDNKPTNSQFIAEIADHFRLEEAGFEVVGQN